MDFQIQDQIAHFQRRLRETVAWCSLQNWSTNFAQGLRTDGFRPSEQARVEQTFFHRNELWDKSHDEFWDKTPWQRQQVVERLAIQRAEALQTQNITLPQIIQPLTGGRLLLFDLESTLSDGAAYDATRGFLDGDSVPAWDTWILYVVNDSVSASSQPSYDYLLSWVPEPLVALVSQAIEVDIGECIQWAADFDTLFIQQLKQASLVL